MSKKLKRTSAQGFIGVAALIAIVLGLIVIGGGAYYLMHQNSTSQTPESYPSISTTEQTQTINTPTETQQTTNASTQTTPTENPPTPTPAPTGNNSSSPVSFSVPSTFTVGIDQTAKNQNANDPKAYETITFNSISGSSANISIAQNSLNCGLDCAEMANPYLYQTFSATLPLNQTVYVDGEVFILKSLSPTAATIFVDEQESGTTINKDSLQSTSGNPVLSGMTIDTNPIYVSVYPEGETTEVLGKTDTTVTPVNGTWSVQLSKKSDPSFTLSPGLYSIFVNDVPSDALIDIAGELVVANVNSTSNMSQYTDSNFGFSFWYPHYSNNWSVQTASNLNPKTPSTLQGGTLAGVLDVIDAQNNTALNMQLAEYNLSGDSFTDSDGVETMTYTYNAQTGEWSGQTNSPYSGDQIDPTLGTTIGGQLMIRGPQSTNASHENVVMVFLSSTKVVVVSTIPWGGNNNKILAQTIAPAGAAISPSQQATALQLESQVFNSYPH